MRVDRRRAVVRLVVGGLGVGVAGLLAAAAARGEDSGATLIGELTVAVAGAVAAAEPAAQTAGQSAPCPGDCDGNGVVSVDEMIRGVLIAATALPVTQCPAFDTDGNGIVTINELIAGIRRAIEGCSGTGAQSVCGGPITSTPKLCNLSVQPARVEAGRSIRVSFGMSDLEGDINRACLGIGRIGGSGMEQCNPLEPVGETINLVAESPDITVNLDPGDYELAFLLIDAADQRSEVATARFTVIRLRR